MKEATGELNMTVVTVVAIAALLAFFYLAIWPNLQAGMALSSACNSAGTTEYSITNEDGSTIECNTSAVGIGKCQYKTATNKTQTKTCDVKTSSTKSN